MTKNIMTFIAVVSSLSIVSCKNKDENSSIVLDTNNRIVPQFQTDQLVVKPTNTMKPADYPKIQIENSDFDFGDIIQGEKVSHLFKLKNTGKGDLIILEARASCGCTVPEWTKSPIKSGEMGEVSIIFNSDGKSGKQEKTITLKTNTEAGSEIIHFKANINPKAEKNSAKN